MLKLENQVYQINQTKANSKEGANSLRYMISLRKLAFTLKKEKILYGMEKHARQTEMLLQT